MRHVIIYIFLPLGFEFILELLDCLDVFIHVTTDGAELWINISMALTAVAGGHSEGMWSQVLRTTRENVAVID